MATKPDNGLAKVLARMEAVKLAAKEAAMQQLIKGANDVATIQRQLVRVDEGDLRDSITVTLPGQSTPPHAVTGGQRVAAENQVLVTAGNSDVRYPHHVEHGTVKMDAHPFFNVAYRLKERGIKRTVASTFGRVARKIWNQK